MKKLVKLVVVLLSCFFVAGLMQSKAQDTTVVQAWNNDHKLWYDFDKDGIFEVLRSEYPWYDKEIVRPDEGGWIAFLLQEEAYCCKDTTIVIKWRGHSLIETGDSEVNQMAQSVYTVEIPADEPITTLQWENGEVSYWVTVTKEDDRIHLKENFCGNIYDKYLIRSDINGYYVIGRISLIVWSIDGKTYEMEVPAEERIVEKQWNSNGKNYNITFSTYYSFVAIEGTIDGQSYYTQIERSDMERGELHYGDYVMSVYGDRKSTLQDGREKRWIYQIFDSNCDGKIDIFRYEDITPSPIHYLQLDADNNYEVAFAAQNDAHKNPFNIVEADINLDGRTDYYFYGRDGKHHILVQQVDGSFFETDIQLVTDEDEIGAQHYGLNSGYGNKFVRPFVNFGGLCGVSKGSSSDVYENITLSVDMNMDGYPDFLDTQKGGAFFSMGDGRRYYPAEFNGTVEVRDFNGDYIPDYIVFDQKTGIVSLNISSNGSFESKQLFKNSYISKFFCRDLDGDGDTDILLAINHWGEESANSYLVPFINDGSASFKRREWHSLNQYEFYDCIDIDNTGRYAVIATERISTTDGTECRLVTLSMNDSYQFVAETLVEKLSSNEAYTILDYDNNGVLELFYRRPFESSPYLEFSAVVPISKNVNTRPLRMEKPTCVFDGESGLLRVEWKSGSDKETSVSDLTYALRIGSQPGSGDMLYAYASPDGVRLRPGEGNMGHNMFKLLSPTSWPSGDYYIAVQAVDANGLGGEWSEETVYHNESFGASFLIDKNEMTTGDTLHVRLLSAYRPDWVYQYHSSDDAKIKHDECGGCTICFSTFGEKMVSLTVSTTDAVVSESQNITVYASPVVETGTGMEDFVDESYRYDLVFFDFDSDGTPEVIREDGLYKKDSSGKFTKFPALFNTDLRVYSSVIADDNRDGKPDILYVESSGILSNLINDGDCYFNAEPVTLVFEQSDTEFYTGNGRNPNFVDLDNDGLLDVIVEDSVYRNMGNNRFRWQPTSISNEGGNLSFADFNRDGYIDLLYYESNDDAIYLNMGNYEWKKIPLPQLKWYPNSKINVVDVNNDGYFDLLCRCWFTQNTYIFWGNAEMTYTSFTELPFYAPSTGIDIDNNGIIELIDDNTKNLYYYLDNETFWEEVYDRVTNDHSIIPQMMTMWADINGDGTPDTWKGINHTAIENERPEAPTGVVALPTSSGVRLTWNPAYDKETPKHQMRYNVSLKKKGAVGDNAYILSPLNETSDDAMPLEHEYINHYVFSQNYRFSSSYKQSTVMMLPLDAFETDTEYELCVQAIDLWNMASPFSEIYTFLVPSLMSLDMPTEGGLGQPTRICYIGTKQEELSWDWDGGEATYSDKNTYTVVWNTPGVKTVTCRAGGENYSQTILIRQLPELSFALPDTVFAGVPLTVELPEIFSDVMQDISLISSSDVQIEHECGTTEAVVTFPDNDGIYTLSVVYEDDIFGRETRKCQTVVVGANYKPEIEMVSIDGETGKNAISWVIPDFISNSGWVRTVKIYRETSTTNVYELLNECPLEDRCYVDMQSLPSVRKYRYCISLCTSYGAESRMSEVHSSLHLMINKGLGNTLNLMWNPYEGGTVESYYVLRGRSPDNLTLLAQLNGNETSYTDMDIPEEGCFYALSYDRLSIIEPVLRSLSRETPQVKSNVVSSLNSNEVTMASSITIRAIESDVILDEESTLLHLYAEVAPVTATFGEVSWSIIEGEDYATISSFGNLSLIPGKSYQGNIVVQAMAKDGSQVTATYTVPMSVSLAEIPASDEAIKFYYDSQGQALHITGVTLPVTLSFYALNGTLLFNRILTADSIVPLNIDSGIYVAVVDGKAVKVEIK